MTTAELQKFHQKHKLLLMAHSPELYRTLGALAANSCRRPGHEVKAEYDALFAKALATPTALGKQVNVFQHAFGYFKDGLTSEEKARILGVLESYAQGRVPFGEPLALLEGLLRRLPQPYLDEPVAVFAAAFSITSPESAKNSNT